MSNMERRSEGDESIMEYILIGNLPDGTDIEYVKEVISRGFGEDVTVRQVVIEGEN